MPASDRVLVFDDQDGGGHAAMLHRAPQGHRRARVDPSLGPDLASW